MATVETPHFDLPFTLSDKASVVEQDSLDDVANCVVVILGTYIGQRDLVPALGVPDFSFRKYPIGPEQLLSILADQEPRAVMEISERLNTRDTLLDLINIKLSITAQKEE